MNIVIGETVKIGPSAQYRPDGEAVSVEARLLEIRDRRETSASGSVSSGRIITLLVPDGQPEYLRQLRWAEREPRLAGGAGGRGSAPSLLRRG